MVLPGSPAYSPPKSPGHSNHTDPLAAPCSPPSPTLLKPIPGFNNDELSKAWKLFTEGCDYESAPKVGGLPVILGLKEHGNSTIFNSGAVGTNLPENVLRVVEEGVVTPRFFKLGSKLGEGAGSKVYDVKEWISEEKKWMGMQCVDKRPKRGGVKQALKEMNNMRNLPRSEYIFKLVCCPIVSMRGKVNDLKQYRNRDVRKQIGAHLLIERAKVPLSKVLSKLRRLDKVEHLNVSFTIALHLARGLRDMHNVGIMHGDIKPANIGVSPEGIFGYFDFDCSSEMKDSRQRLSHLGTFRFRAPEASGSGQKFDVYAFGVALQYVLQKPLLFPRSTTTRQISGESLGEISEIARRRNAEDRPTALELVNLLEALKSNSDLVEMEPHEVKTFISNNFS